MLRGAVLTLLLAAALLAAGCGGGAKPAATPKPRPCVDPAAARALTRIQADLAALRKAAKLPVRDHLQGNAAVNRATDAFMRDVDTAPISNVRRNRLIDHAAAALLGACEQCFQALEADRPIVTMVHSSHRGNCQK